MKDNDFVQPVEKLGFKDALGLIEKGYDPQYGARPMRRAVERFLEDPLAEELLRGTVKPGDKVEVVAADAKLSFQVPESQAQNSAAASAS